MTGFLSDFDYMQFEPREIVAPVLMKASLPEIIPTLQFDRDIEIVRWRNIAQQLFVSLGCFPAGLAKNPEQKVFPRCVALSRKAFGNLATVWHDKKQQALYRRFQKDLMRYLDVVLCGREESIPQFLPYDVLQKLAECGSKYSIQRLTSVERH